MVVDRRVECWAFVHDMPEYMISDEGNVFNRQTDKPMSTSINQFGHVKISLYDYKTGDRHTRSVRLLVAEAFVEKPGPLCDHVLVLDGNPSNVVWTNLAWRPRWFVWKYSRQLKEQQPIHYQNMSVTNVTTGVRHHSIVGAGMSEGLLFEDIWTSTYRGQETFPYGSIFQIG